MDLHAGSKALGAIVAVVGGLYTGGTWIDARFAKTSDIQTLRSDARFTNLRLEEKILTDRTVAIQTRLWSLEDRHGRDLTTAPSSVREEYRQMAVDLADVRRQIQSVMEQYRAVGYPATDSYYRYEQPHR